MTKDNTEYIWLIMDLIIDNLSNDVLKITPGRLAEKIYTAIEDYQKGVICNQ